MASNKPLDHLAHAQQVGEQLLSAIKQAHETIQELKQLNKEYRETKNQWQQLYKSVVTDSEELIKRALLIRTLKQHVEHDIKTLGRLYDNVSAAIFVLDTKLEELRERDAKNKN